MKYVVVVKEGFWLNLSINHQSTEEAQYVFLKGEIDVYTSTQLKEEIIPLVEKRGNKVIVDLTEVEYIDSTGLGIFIGALKASRKNESSIKLTGLSERVRRLFSITGLDEVIEIEETSREEAK